jgi:hypothetical protein
VQPPPRQPPPASEVRAGAELPAQLPLGPSQFAFVVDIDGDPYLQLGAIEDPKPPRHGRARRAASDTQPGQTIAVAPVKPAALSADDRAWLGRLVVVDGTCRARVDGFALRAGLSGDGVDAMSPRDILEQGEPTLVAHLDSCRGGKIARDASLAPAPGAIVDDAAADAAALRALAERDLWASEPGRTDHAMQDAANAREGSDAHQIETASTVVVHPTTHERFVIVHASLFGEMCSDAPSFNLTGVYKVAATGDLVRVFVGDTGELDLHQPLVDLDGDGVFELIGERAVTSLRGEPVASRRGDDFIGCPC